jgi:large subunit ribosomal protein L19
MPIIDKVEKAFLKKNPAQFRAGDVVRVDVEIIEGESRRIQAFEGVVISPSRTWHRHKLHGAKISFGVGVERTFPLHSPRIQGIKVLRSGKVRRAKLYYLRELSGKRLELRK